MLLTELRFTKGGKIFDSYCIIRFTRYTHYTALSRHKDSKKSFRQNKKIIFFFIAFLEYEQN